MQPDITSEWENHFIKDIKITQSRASSFFIVYKNNNILHNEVQHIEQEHKRSHAQQCTSHDRGASQCEGSEESSGSTENTENSSYLFSPTLRKVLMSSFMSPVEIHAAMKAALFLFLFILLPSFRPDIHYSFHLLRGRARHCNFNFSPLQKLSLLRLNRTFTCADSNVHRFVRCSTQCTVPYILYRSNIQSAIHFISCSV